MERVKGIEPSSSAWEAAALPLSYTRAAPGREGAHLPGSPARVNPNFGKPLRPSYRSAIGRRSSRNAHSLARRNVVGGKVTMTTST